MRIYVVMINDRHYDQEAHLFSTEEKAMYFVKQVLADVADAASDVPEEDATMSAAELKAAGWLFYRCYSTEGDCLWVTTKEVDPDLLGHVQAF